MLAQDRLPHLMLFYGAENSGTSPMALQCAQKLLNASKDYHPDLHQYHPEGKSGMHSLHSIQDICREIYLSSHNGGYKCFIIYNAERMLPSNANALLKTFEEPPKKSIIFLLTSKPSLILPTILSRCQKYGFHAPQEQQRGALEKKLLEILCGKLSISDINEIGDSFEKERKHNESEALKKLPKELSATQKEYAQKEIEGTHSLEYKKKLERLFETVLQFYHDLRLYHINAPSERLCFPQFIEQYKKLEVCNLDLLEQKIQQARMAYDRGMKVHYCLESIL
jgi:DNA polymerase-3 subunit delta'